MGKIYKWIKRLLLALCAIVVACALAFPFVWPWAQREIKSIAIATLAERCRCDASIDALAIDLSDLSVSIDGVDLRRGGEPGVRIARLFADLDVSNLLDGRLDVTEVRVERPEVVELGEGSVLRDLIEGPPTPPSPEPAEPSSFTVRLRALTLSDGALSHSVGPEQRLETRGIRLGVTGDDQGRLTAKLTVRELGVVDREAPERTVQGTLAITARIDGGDVDLESSVLAIGDSSLRVTGSVANQVLDLRADADLDAEEIAPGRGVHGAVRLQASVTGPVVNPTITARIGSTKPLGLADSKHEALTITKLAGAAAIHLEEAGIRVEVPELEVRGPNIEIHATQPITYTPERTTGALSVDIPELSYEGSRIQGGAIRIDLNGPVTPPSTTEAFARVRASFRSVTIADHTYAPLSVTADVYGDRAKLGIEHSSRASGRIDGRGEVRWLPEPRVESVNVALADFKVAGMAIDGSVTGSGPLSPTALTADAHAEIRRLEPSADPSDSSAEAPPFSALSLDLSLKEGLARASFRELQGLAKGSAEIDLSKQRPSTVELTIPELALDRFSEKARCGVLGVDAKLSFPLDSPLEGQGTVTLGKLAVGCAPDTVTVRTPHVIRIENGAVNLGTLTASDTRGRLVLEGSASRDNLDIRAHGSLNLEAFAALVPQIEGLIGRVEVHASVKGVPTQPHIEGTLALHDAGAQIEAARVALSDLDGTVNYTPAAGASGEIAGKVNGGTLELTAHVNPASLDQATVALRVRNMEVSPRDEITALVDADIIVDSPVQAPAIRGRTTIRHAQVEKNIGIDDALKILESLIPRKVPAQVTYEREEPARPIPLDLEIDAPGQAFLVTNWVETELGADLKVTGTSSAPRIRGKVETLNGSFTIGRYRFDISSGQLLFDPARRLPLIELQAETTVAAAGGETVYVSCSIAGPADAPKVIFTSDNDMSQQEIISLLTGGSGGSTGSLVKSIAAEAGIDSFNLLDEDSALGLGGIFGLLTRLDKLTVEPVISPRTGAIEPKILAEKRLTRAASVKAETSPSEQKKLHGEYLLMQDVTVSGGMNIAGGSEPTSTSADIEYEAIPEQRALRVRVVDVESLDGPVMLLTTASEKVDEAALLAFLRLSERSRIRADQLPTIERRVRQFYANRGNRAAAAKLECGREGLYCRELTIRVALGPPSEIAATRWSRDTPSPAEESDLDLPTGGELATKERLDEAVTTTLEMMRKSGFLSAFVSGEYVAKPGTSDVDLVLHLSKGPPVRIEITGNETFGDDELRKLTKLDTRKFPVGPMAIQSLADRIREHYRAADYPDATVEVTKTREEPEGATLYLVTVHEGEKVDVVEVCWRGRKLLDRKALSKALSGPELEEIYEPRYLPAQLRNNADKLRGAYERLGYPNASVSFDLARRPDGNGMVTYTVDSGEYRAFAEVRVLGLPEGVEAPVPPKGVLSEPVLDEYENQLRVTLRDRGYPAATLERESEPTLRALDIVVAPGTPTRVGDIVLRGLEEVDEAVVRAHVALRPGDVWDQEKINQSRRAIARLNLFSQVNAAPGSGEIQGERQDLVISVVERNLESLTVGLGYDSTFGARIFSEGVERKLFGDGREISFDADIFLDPTTQNLTKGLVTFRYADPYFLDSDHRFSQDASFRKLTRSTQEFDLERVSTSTLFSRSFPWGLQYSFGFSLLQENLDDVAPDVVLSDLDRGSPRLAFLTGSVGYDRRDDALDTRKGFILTLDHKLSTHGLLSQADFAAFGLRFTAYRPTGLLDDRVTLAFTTKAASAWTFGDTDEVPITQRYYLGGLSTVRGFRENSLGPRGSLGNVIGGDSSLLFSTEVGYLIREKIAAHAFLDAGNVFLRSRDDEFDMRYGAGPGIRYLSPIGPVGFDIGVPLDERSGEPSVRFHLNIGGSF